ncbi:MAG: hypothetical protein AAFN79_15925 [Pseudomonadota bacterium]
MKKLLAPLAVALAPLPSFAAETITVTGEAIDTWCYFSGVMGGPEAVVGSAHHTCALWCAAGGIPVGLLTEEGDVYMVLKIENDDHTNGGDKLLEIAAHEITATGEHHVRDGVNYLIVNEVVADAGLVNLSHEEWDVTPGFAIPDPNK